MDEHSVNDDIIRICRLTKRRFTELNNSIHKVHYIYDICKTESHHTWLLGILRVCESRGRVIARKEWEEDDVQILQLEIHRLEALWTLTVMVCWTKMKMSCTNPNVKTILLILTYFFLFLGNQNGWYMRLNSRIKHQHLKN